MDSDRSETDAQRDNDGAGRGRGDVGDVTQEVAHAPTSKSSLPPPGESPDGTDYRNPELPPDLVTWTRESELATDLTAEVKAEIVRQGAIRRQLRIKRRDVAASEVFFHANPMWTAAHLLGLWQTCGRLGEVSGGWDRLWHARRGKDFKFLLLNLDKVVHQLGVADKVPQFVTVAPEELYKPRKPRNRKPGKADDQ